MHNYLCQQYIISSAILSMPTIYNSHVPSPLQQNDITHRTYTDSLVPLCVCVNRCEFTELLLLSCRSDFSHNPEWTLGRSCFPVDFIVPAKLGTVVLGLVHHRQSWNILVLTHILWNWPVSCWGTTSRDGGLPFSKSQPHWDTPTHLRPSCGWKSSQQSERTCYERRLAGLRDYTSFRAIQKYGRNYHRIKTCWKFAGSTLLPKQFAEVPPLLPCSLNVLNTGRKVRVVVWYDSYKVLELPHISESLVATKHSDPERSLLLGSPAGASLPHSLLLLPGKACTESAGLRWVPSPSCSTRSSPITWRWSSGWRYKKCRRSCVGFAHS